MENNEQHGFSFDKLAISPEIKKAVAEMGFINATPIQEGTIPLIMAGKDVIGYSQTGTGKTAAFGIPAIENIDLDNPKQTQVLVLCPTRELAVQAHEEIKKFAKYKRGIKSVCIYGGDSMERQIRELKQGAQIVIGTPGRIMDHMRRNTLKLQNLKMIILDEADEMLNIGFREDIETILQDCPEDRQTILFSATMPPAIVAITKEYQRDPIMVRGQNKGMTVPAIEQIYYEAPIGHKEDVLCSILNLYDPKRSMIFCNTKKMVDELTENLQARGYLAEGLHGDMRQTARSQIMNKFKNGKTNILIATDVAARGIDVEDIEAVFNYDIPNDQEYCIHRIGRTGRAGKSGRAFTIVSGRKQVYALRDIQHFTKAKIAQKPLPSSKEINQKQFDKFVDKVNEIVAENNNQSFENVIDKLLAQGLDLKEIAVALVRMQLSDEIITEPLAYEKIMQQSSFRERRSEHKGLRQGGSKNSSNKNMVKLSINVGAKKGITPNHIVGAIAQATGLPGKVIGHIDIYPECCVVEVDKRHEAQILSVMKKCKIKGVMTSTTPYKQK